MVKFLACFFLALAIVQCASGKPDILIGISLIISSIWAAADRVITAIEGRP